eukprot:CAMPEP_0202373202 /NCGR_PEP_ID=MMETSP1127-20130417/4264_1 /ASSEMBLY_ACC=CAM_ASM_000462 /TAXON_ID=3047 /ORGANISM="Dunaliella tertiolecta, Strain CCMP1320" /LENGTH=457 /DNA_ID=CAMNT_0048970001 /DNA_START=123 /DNA_END=1496 /DNA_ORIENTATION=-
MVRSKSKRLLEGAYLGRGQYQYKVDRPTQSNQPVRFVSAGQQLEGQEQPQQQQQQKSTQGPGSGQNGQWSGDSIEQQRRTLEVELEALEQRERHLLWLQQQQLQQQQILQRQRDEEQRQQDGCEEQGPSKHRRLDDEAERCLQGQGVSLEDRHQHHQHPRQHEAGPRQQERDSQHVGHESQAAPEQRRADVEVERCWLGQGVRTHQWYQQQRHQQQTGPSARGLKQDDGTRGADRAPISIARAPLSVRALKQQQQQQHVVELPPPPPLPVPTSLSPSPLAPSQHLPPPPPLPLPPSLQAPLPPHLQPALPLPTPLQPALPFAPELLPPHLRQACYFFTPNYLHLPPPPAGKKPLSKNGRKAARKKANKRARAQGLAPPGSGSAPTKKRSSKDADEARAAAEAAQNKFAGFEDHTSGIGSRLLAKMGWRSGEGLGQKAQGRSEPVIPQLIKGKRGLGA